VATCKILIVDDEPLLGQSLKRTLEVAGHQVRLAQSGAEALEAIAEESFDLLLEDLRLPDADGMEIMRVALRRMPDCMALVMTGHGTIEGAVEAMKCGAVDFLLKPFSMEALLTKIADVVELQQMQNGTKGLSTGDTVSSDGFTRSPIMRAALNEALAFAATTMSVHLEGESGSGKEFIADFIHNQSPRRAKPCVKVNCAAIPETLFESELFGVERGAFTDAVKSRNGYLDEADGGTLFLDEIAELPLKLQAKLLRTIDEKTFYRVGATKMRQVDFRLITATNRNLLEMVHAGEFREDLYFRIHMVQITVPPLRERREDIPSFIKLFSGQHQSADPACKLRFTPEAFEALTTYNYPGNVRELKNIIEHLAIIHPGETIRPRHLARLLQHADVVERLFETFATGKSLREAITEFERKYIKKVLQSVDGHKTRSAGILGLSRKVLWEKLKRHKLDDHPS
jgi:DNA-binding NtrC family response regulator